MIRKLIHRIFRRTAHKDSETHPNIIAVAQHGVRRDQLSPAALKVTTRLQEANFSAFVVGGAVRDLLLGVEPKDFDVATDATPEEVHRLFRRSRIIGRRFRIVHVVFGRDEVIEVTTFRGDGTTVQTAASGRILSDNTYGNQADDARRRDFTVNALFYDPDSETVLDYYHGMKDLAARQLVMIGQPLERYKEDPVRMLRAVRLAAKLGFSIEENTRKPIAQLAPLLKDVASARLFDEMLKMLHSGHAWLCLTRLRDEGLHHGIFPLLDTILEQEEGAEFVKLALDNTDQRLREGRGISDGFLFATLLWGQVNSEWQRRLAQGEKSIPALLAAMDGLESRQDHELAIPRRYVATMREIWGMQPRFDVRSGARPYRLLEQPRFRAAYDFLYLRAEAGEVPLALVEWWTAFQTADEATRQVLLAQADAPSAVKKKRRRRKKPANAAGGVDSIEQDDEE